MTGEAGSGRGRSVLVLGGGIVGVTTAYFLTRRGFDVTIVEAQAEVALGASHGNGGLFTAAMSDPWNSPGLPLKLLKSGGREDSPYLVRGAALPGLVPWGLRFLWNCRPTAARRAIERSYRLATYSLAKLEDAVAETGIRFDRMRKGALKIFADTASLAAVDGAARKLAPAELVHSVVDAAACVDMVPILTPRIGNIVGGIHFPGDETGDPAKFTRALAAVCERRGADIRLGTTVSDIIIEGGRISGLSTDHGRMGADHYVLALGHVSGRLAARIGLRLPIYPVKGYSVTVSLGDRNPGMPFVDARRRLVVVPLGNRLRVVGLAEFTGFDADPGTDRCSLLVRYLGDLLPDLDEAAIVERWSGLRPVTPDGLPVIGPTRYENLFVNTGHGPLGVTMSCASAAAVSALIAGDEPEIDIRPFAPSRF